MNQNKKLQAIVSCAKSKCRLHTWGYSKMLHLQETCGIQNQRQVVDHAYLDRTRVFPSHGCARSKPQILTSLPSLKLFRLTRAYVWMIYELFNFGSVCWKHDPVSQSRETLSVIDVSFTFWQLCLWVHRPRSAEHSQQLSLNQLSIIEDNAAMIQMINKGRSPKVRHVTRTHGVDLEWLSEQMILDHSIFIPCWNCGKSDDPMNQVLSAAILTNPSLAHLQQSPNQCRKWRHKPRVLTRCGINTRAKYWNQVAFWTSIWPWNNWEIMSSQDNRDLLAGMLFTMGAEVNLLQVESSFRPCETNR